jgi:hypothetical protein
MLDSSLTRRLDDELEVELLTLARIGEERELSESVHGRFLMLTNGRVRVEQGTKAEEMEAPHVLRFEPRVTCRLTALASPTVVALLKVRA